MTATPSPDANRKLLNRTGASVAILLVLLLGIALGALMRFEVPADNHDIILILITTVANSVIAIVGYFFGSSVATSRQGEIIATQASTIAAAQDKLPPAPGAPDKTVPIAAGETVSVKAADTGSRP